MKRVTVAIALALSAASFTSAEAQLSTNLQFRAPLNYRYPVTPRNHSFANHQHRNAWHRHRHFYPLPALAGPMVIYQNGEIGIPPENEVVGAIPQTPVQPVIYRIGEIGGCGLQQVSVPGSHGRTTVNIWRC